MHTAGRSRPRPPHPGGAALGARGAPGDRLKIAYLGNIYPMTSVTFIRREIRALEAEGVEVLRFSLRPPEASMPSPADHEEAARTRVILASGAVNLALSTLAVALRSPRAFLRALRLALRIGWRSDRGLVWNLAYLVEACVLRRWLRAAGEVDHLHAHFATNPAAVAMLCRELGGPTYSFTVHGPHEFDMPAFIAVGEKIARSAFTVAISSYGRSQLCRWAAYGDWPKIQVVHCGVPEDLLEAPRTDVPDVPRLVCVARLGEQKGHLMLVEAAALLAAEGLDFELVLVGDGPLRGEIERQIAARGLERRFRLVGALSNDAVRDAIVASRAMVLPSFAEGLPVVLMEALALGRPVISTAIAGTPELVEPGVNGWLVPAGAVEPLARALREVLRTPTARLTEMGQAGRARVARDHDVRREARRLAELFRTVVARGALTAPEGAVAAPVSLQARP